MRSRPDAYRQLRSPQLLDKAEQLAASLRSLTAKQLESVMHLSPALAVKTRALLAAWTIEPAGQSPAIDSFVGDIYSGLRADTLSPADRSYADHHLRILSGLYGILRPQDGVCPYRLEMGCTVSGASHPDLYKFWGTSIVQCLPPHGLLVNLAAQEYSRTVTPYVDSARIITPKFLTIDPKTRQPAFVVVHAKIARGAFARWLITTRTTAAAELTGFADIGYRFDRSLSKPQQPVFVCETFAGKGLSMRLQK